ncbi:MAG: ATP-binding protein [Cyclobacteriaceae bacterium]
MSPYRKVPWFQKLKISNKLSFIMIGMSMMVIVLVSALFYHQFSNAMTERVLMQLSSVARLKKVQIESIINGEIENVQSLIATAIPDSATIQDDFFYISDDNPLQHMQIPEEIKELPVPSEKGTIYVHDLIPQFENMIIIAFTARSSKGASIKYVLYLPEIQDILLERTGLGSTGESYLIGPDNKMRSKSRFLDVNPTTILVETEGVKMARKADEGTGLIKDYRNVDVFSAFQKIDIKGLSWVLLSEIDYTEAMEPLQNVRAKLFGILALAFILLFVSAYFISSFLVKPILSVERSLIDISKGIVNDYQIKYSGKDEIEQMVVALQNVTYTLRSTISFAQDIGAGNFDISYTPKSQYDMLGNALVSMAKELSNYRSNEEKLIQQNRRSLIEGQESERARLSREMHDGLGPLLTNLRFRIQTVTLDEQLKSNLINIIDNTINEVRRMSYNLMPSVLQDFGAGDAIENLVKQMSESTGIDIQLKRDVIAKEKIEANIHLALYRLTQEAVNNAIKHANPEKIRISLTKFDDHISLYIADDGPGFDPENIERGNGLSNMEERVKLVNGQLIVNSDTNGTSIEVEIPIA